jgi:hypothetical protein
MVIEFLLVVKMVKNSYGKASKQNSSSGTPFRAYTAYLPDDGGWWISDNNDNSRQRRHTWQQHSQQGVAKQQSVGKNPGKWTFGNSCRRFDFIVPISPAAAGWRELAPLRFAWLPGFRRARALHPSL